MHDYSSALSLALEAIPAARDIVAKVRRVDRHLADQLRRAISSIVLNLAEADGNRDGGRRMRLETALGSVKEASVALRLAVGWGYVGEAEILPLENAIDRVGAMTYRRMHPR